MALYGRQQMYAKKSLLKHSGGFFFAHPGFLGRIRRGGSYSRRGSRESRAANRELLPPAAREVHDVGQVPCLVDEWNHLRSLALGKKVALLQDDGEGEACGFHVDLLRHARRLGDLAYFHSGNRCESGRKLGLKEWVRGLVGTEVKAGIAVRAS